LSCANSLQVASVNTLDRFLLAQSGGGGVDFDQALKELNSGEKTSHWIWYILPQLRGLGRSDLAREYGIRDAEEAAAFLAHPVLGPRLVSCVNAMLVHKRKGARAVLGPVDAMKFRSCLTLFEHVSSVETVFGEALDSLYGGLRDQATLALLKVREHSGP
jgi:uncharacterized protein (DUF1810 family)